MNNKDFEILYCRLPIGSKKKLKIIAKFLGLNTITAFLIYTMDSRYNDIPQEFIDNHKK